MILILLIILAVTLGYWKLFKHYRYWTARGIKQRKQIYFLGDHASMFFRKESIYDALNSMYNAFPGERYMGMYQMLLPTLLIRDPELIKQITVKDFDHFLNHQAYIPEGIDPLWNKNLFALKDNQWREMRSTLSPTFTSSKMKMIFTLISDCADEFTDHFWSKGCSQILEMKDTFTRYANDVIASVVFGVKCDSLKEKNNQFYTMGAKATKFSAATNLKFFLFLLAPRLSKVLGIKFFPSEVKEFFLRIVQETIHMRESQGIVRPDMLNLLLEARKGRKIQNTESNGLTDTGFATVEESTNNTQNKSPKQYLSDLDIAAQALIFFFGGFESVATLMSFTIYELTLNPEIQEKLQKEIDETLEECNGKLTYESLMTMKYMDMIVSETLRKWPPAIITDRVCNKVYTIQPVSSHEKPVHIKLDDIVWIPIIAIHYDAKYFPNPQQFDPERFNDENKTNIKPYTYFPFGSGPRNCIGSRFALMETKTILFYILSKFDLLVCEKTDIPIKLSKKETQLTTENGIWIELKPREKK